jgi:GDP-L-fucose synthase
MNFYHNKKVLVTGGSGFIGSHLVEELVKLKAHVTVPSRQSNPPFLSSVKSKIKIVKADLKRLDVAKKLTQNQDLVFHLSALVGGIHYNNAHPATLLYDNLLPTINIIESAKVNKTKRLLVVSSACVYSPQVSIPTPESEGFLDEPEPTNYGYGWSKRIAELLAKTYSEEHQMKIGIVRPYNAYGPRDDFDPKQSHVIPALIKKVCDGENPLVVWGNGSATRSFIYVTDIVRGMLTALEKHPQPDPINLGTTEEINIKNLSQLIIKLSGKSTKIKFDTNKPNGQLRRNCDIKKAKKILNFKAQVKLTQGLPKVINYYLTHVQKKS